MTVVHCYLCREPIMNEEPSEYRGEPACGECRRRALRAERARRSDGGKPRRSIRGIEGVRQHAGVGNQGPGCAHSDDNLPCTDCFLEGDA